MFLSTKQIANTQGENTKNTFTLLQTFSSGLIIVVQ